MRVHGGSSDWASMFDDLGAHRVELPTYAFQRKRYWMSSGAGSADAKTLGVTAAGHPMLGALVPQAESGSIILTGRLSLATHPWLGDHRVRGVALMPGSAMVELALHAGDRVGCPRIDELVLRAPLIVGEHGGVVVQVVVGAWQETGERPVRIYSRIDNDGTDRTWTLNAEGILSDPPYANIEQAVAEWPPAGAEPVDVAEAYPMLAERGYEYGPAFRGLRAVWRRGDEVFVEAALPEQAKADANQFGLHPVLLDAILHGVGASGVLTESELTRLPFEWEGVSLHVVGATQLRARVTLVDLDTISITVMDSGGGMVASVDSLALRGVSPSQLRVSTTADDELYGVDWVTLAAGEATDTTIAEDVTVLRCPTTTGNTSALLEETRDALALVLERTQHWLADVDRDEKARLVVLTRRAIAVDSSEDVVDLGQASVWGLLRSAQSENPGQILLVDVDDWACADIAVAESTRRDESQLAVRDGVCFAPRLVHAAADRIGGAELIGGTSWRLAVLDNGTLDPRNFNLRPWPESERVLAPGEVRIGLRCAGVNFRDVLISLGLYSDAEATVGSEGSGVVLEVAEGVVGFARGDRVMGLFDGAGPVVVADHRTIAHIPAGWSYAQAAAVPAAFLTAYYTLADLGRVRAGERLLVHAATGGVGMAAVQLALHWGLEVFATASPGKWEILRGMGFEADHIANSRAVDFEQKFSATTGGQGVDIVLDSLTGEFVDSSLRLLPRGGRFIEMGKSDVRDADEVAARHPGVRYRAFDLAEAGLDRAQDILGELVSLFEAGELRPIPVHCWDIRHASDAYRYLSRARHVGKLVLTVPRPLDPEGTVLITGGTGVLGMLLARHLVARHGVRNLLLISRRGRATDGAAAFESELTELGASVHIASCDAADRVALQRLLAGIPDDHPLTAVIHAAGVLDDAMLGTQTPRHLESVLRPKIDAGWNLHELTRSADLSAFVVFSSAASVLGSRGQANYAAANAFLDALAHHRRQQGLPGISMAWGWWAQTTGMTGHLDDHDRARMSRSGFVPMSSDEGLAHFDAALLQARSFVVPAHLNLAAVRSDSALTGLPTVFRGLIRGVRRSAESVAVESSSDLRQRLAAMSPSEQERELLGLVRAHAAAVLGYDSQDAVEADEEFKNLGFDSLGAVEFRNRFKSATGLKLPAKAVFDHPTPSALARHLVSALGANQITQPTEERSNGDVEQEYWPVTGYQRDILAVSARYPDLPVAQAVAYTRLDGTVDLDRMKECLRRTHLRNDAVRLRFEIRDDEFVQRVGAEVPELEFVDFTGEVDPEAACRCWIDEAGEEVLPLNGSLVRVAVLVDRTDSFILYGCFHHAVGDGWSVNLAMGQLSYEYQSEIAARGTDDITMPSYLDFVRTERHYRHSPDWVADREYFVEEFRDVEPALFARSGSMRSRTRHRHALNVNPEMAERIRATGHSIFAFTAAAVGEYLRRVHRGRDIVIGVPFLNRSSDAELGTVGCMVNILPLRIVGDDNASMSDLADRVRQRVWDLRGRQRFAYGDIVSAVQEGDGASSPMFDVTYSYQTIPDDKRALALWKRSTVLASGYSLDAVNISVRDNERDGSLDVDVFYADDVFDANYRFADAMRHVLTLIRKALDAPDMQVGELDMLSEADRTQLTTFSSGAPIDA
ncbi:SDR family NAD(P)-dependent oxidoreductase [Mycobacterium sp. JS623]|uniref:SDR family NAD(P)-dependent oxidoreductase n=1 Tax=Mycobacterium sp. JS623 TaxID=212767 RepID=UPI003FA5CC11